MTKKQNLADLIVMHADVLAKFIEAGFPITIGGTITLLPSVEKSPESIKVEMPEPATAERPVPTSDDEEAPFGRDSKGRAIAPYGLKSNGHPKRSAAGRPPATTPAPAAETTETETDSLEMSGDELDLSLEDDAPPPPVAKPAQKSAKPAAAPAPKATPKAAPKAAPAADPFDDILADL